MKLLNVGCGTHYAKGWVNTDVWSDDTTRPDVRVTPGEPYPFDDNTFDAVYLGHVMEHIPWPELPAFLADMIRIAKPGVPVLAVGPDLLRTIERWALGQQPWWLVRSVMEHQESASNEWGGAVHHWNCHEERMIEALRHAGFVDVTPYSEVIPVNPSGKYWYDPTTRINWPVVCMTDWQCAAAARTPA